MDVPLVFYSSTTTFWTYSLHRIEEKNYDRVETRKKKLYILVLGSCVHCLHSVLPHYLILPCIGLLSKCYVMLCIHLPPNYYLGST